MGKILTISVAAYNVENYIRDTLESLVIPELLDDLEIFIIDDGGTDKTLAIAKEYELKYPNTFHAIHKSNGGYGTTVNWSIKNATGKYIKLVDGDDWIDANGLKALVKCLKETEVDVVVSNAYIAEEGKAYKEMYPHCKELNNKYMTLEEAAKYPVVAMWGYTFKLDIVRKNYKELPYNTLYTDQIFVIRALINANTITFLKDIVYYWRLGRAEQSNSINSITKNYKQIIKVADIISEEICNVKKKNIEKSYSFQLKRAAAYYSVSILMLCKMKHTIETWRIIKEWERKTKVKTPEIFNTANNSKKLYLLRKTSYLSYWFMKK
mgnify:FL=1